MDVSERIERPTTSRSGRPRTGRGVSVDVVDDHRSAVDGGRQSEFARHGAGARGIKRAGRHRAWASHGRSGSQLRLNDTLGTFWATLAAGDEPSMAQRAALAGCFAHTITTCREAVALLVDTGAHGWNAITVI